MPTVYPLARLAFLPDPALAFIPDGSDVTFLADGARLSFTAEPIVAFDFTPFNVEISTADPASIFNEDTGQAIFNEDTGQTFFAEEAT